MNFSAIHDVKQVITIVVRQTTENTDRPGETITKLRRVGGLIVIFAKFLNSYCRRSLDANVREILALNEQILFQEFSFAAFLRPFLFNSITNGESLDSHVVREKKSLNKWKVCGMKLRYLLPTTTKQHK